MYQIFDGAFNITNVCNLTCSGCESFNNYIFRNHFRFEDYKDKYLKWSKLVAINIVTIHGGEPFTNPDIVNWARGLKQLWPNAYKHYVSTNGTFIKTKKDVCKQLLDLGWYIDVCVHDPALEDGIHTAIEQAIDKPYRIINANDEIRYVAHNSHKPYFVVYKTTDFISSAKTGIDNGKWKFHRSNKTAAHQVCLGGEPPCTHFNKGKMYQCHLTSVSEDLIKQFPIEDYAVNLLQKYKGADPDDDLTDFFDNLHKPLPQCELCPQSYKTHNIAPLEKTKEKQWI